MPVATEVIHVRTQFDLQKKIKEKKLQKGGLHTIVIYCTGCNNAMLHHEKKVVVLGSFLSLKCFTDLVNGFKKEFGFPSTVKVTQGEAEDLLQPLEHDFVSELFQLKGPFPFSEFHNSSNPASES